MNEVRKGLLVFNICLILAFAGAAVAAAKWTTVRVGNLILKIEGKVSPGAYPRHEFAPSSFRTRGQDGIFDAAGLSTCRATISASLAFPCTPKD